MRGDERNVVQKVAFITGASSGIGEALARELAGRGVRVALGARREERLRALAAELGGSARAIAVPCDVTRDGSVEEAARKTIEAWGRIDLTIANAGFAVHAPLAELTLEDYRRQMETNFFGVLRTIFATLPALRESKGRLVIVGSVAGHVAPPNISAYAASKFALRGLADSIRHELAPEGVGVTLVSPGFVATEISRVDNRGQLREEKRTTVPRWIRARPGRAARAIARGIEHGDAEVIVTAHGKALVALSHHTPALLRTMMKRSVF